MNTETRIYLTTRKQWRDWLEKNHDSQSEIWLIYYKKHTAMPRIAYDDAVEEALCFGWIDSLVKRIDEKTFCQKFTPRKDKSSWSPTNKKRVNKLMRQGLMTPAGLAKIKAAKKNGEWEKSEKTVSQLTIPPELLQTLSKNKKALTNFRNFPPSVQRNFINWILSAKRPETKTRRIQQAAELAQLNKRPGMN